MSREIARAIVEDRLKELPKLSYGELAKLVGQVSCDRIKRPDGAEYQVETEARWDSKAGGNIRVIVAADGPGASAFRPLTETFIMSADGSFMGEK
jgi:hypothetical protein